MNSNMNTVKHPVSDFQIPGQRSLWPAKFRIDAKSYLQLNNVLTF